MEIESMIDAIVNLATAGGFAGLAWYLIVYRVPEMQQQFLDALDKQRDKSNIQMDKMRDQQQRQAEAAENMAREFLKTLVRLEQHLDNSRKDK